MNQKHLINFFFELASLRRLTRSHRQFLFNVSDTISDHSFRVAIIGLILASLEHCNKQKVLKMCLFHDVAEARTGDANFVNQQYLDIHEADAYGDQFKNLPMGKGLKALLDEYSRKKTKESKVAKDADQLDQMVLQQEYLYGDQKNLSIWQSHTRSKLHTATAKSLARKLVLANPFEWLYSLAEEKTGKKVKR